MGGGTINTDLGRGQYRLDLDYGEDDLLAEINRAADKIAGLDALIAEKEAEISAQETSTTYARLIMNVAISEYSLAQSSGDGDVDALRDAVVDSTTSYNQLNAGVGKLNLQRQRLEIQRAAFETKKINLEKYDLSTTESVWCADYTLDADGDVATIEVPGEPSSTLIYPGAPEYRIPTLGTSAAGTALGIPEMVVYSGEVSEPSEVRIGAYGVVRGRAVQSASQSFWNIAALPGWQKWRPTYRFGVLTAIDRENNIGAVDLEDATSTAQGLDINQTATLSDVPFEYMSCDNYAFTVGDDVLIKFQEQDWGSPKIIGFKDNPKPCGPNRLFFFMEAYENTVIQLPTTTYSRNVRNVLVELTTDPYGYGYVERDWPTIDPDLGDSVALGINVPYPQEIIHTRMRIRFGVGWSEILEGEQFAYGVPEITSHSSIHNIDVKTGNNDWSITAAIDATNWQALSRSRYEYYLDNYEGDDYLYGKEIDESYSWSYADNATEIPFDIAHQTNWFKSYWDAPPASITVETEDGLELTYALENIGPRPVDIEFESIIVPQPELPDPDDWPEYDKSGYVGVTYKLVG